MLDGEALYFLGLARELQGKIDSAYPCYYKATWNYEFRSSGYYRLAVIDARRSDWGKAREHAAEALVTDARNAKAREFVQLASAKAAGGRKCRCTSATCIVSKDEMPM